MVETKDFKGGKFVNIIFDNVAQGSRSGENAGAISPFLIKSFRSIIE